MNMRCRNHRISVTHGMSGYFAVHLADFEDMDWFPDIVSTGIGRYATKEGAISEAKEWAKSELIPFQE